MTLLRHFTEKKLWMTGLGWPCDLANASLNCYRLQTVDTGLHNHCCTPHTLSGVFQSIQVAMRFGWSRLYSARFVKLQVRISARRSQGLGHRHEPSLDTRIISQISTITWRFYDGVEDPDLLGCDAMSPGYIPQRFGRTQRLHLQGPKTLQSLEIKSIRFFRNVVKHQAIRRQIPKDKHPLSSASL